MHGNLTMHLCVGTTRYSRQMTQRSSEMQSGEGLHASASSCRPSVTPISPVLSRIISPHGASVVNLVLGPDGSNPRTMTVEGVQQLGLVDMDAEEGIFATWGWACSRAYWQHQACRGSSLSRTCADWAG